MTTEILYSVEQLPIFQNLMFNSKEAAKHCTKGDVQLVRDAETGLIFNQAFQPELMQYTKDYQNEQAVSLIFQEHLNNVATIIDRHLHNQTLIEVGCGKGHFMQQLSDQGYQITGIDPTYEGNNPKVIKEYFSPETGISADGIVLRHVLEHVTNPVNFLKELCQANAGSGKIYIEVPCFDWICQRRAWYDIFYEHVNYFRLSDFSRIFGTVYESGHIFGGQYLYVIADLASINKPLPKPTENFIFPSDFLKSVTRYIDRHKGSRDTQTCNRIIWGGASKGVIFALFMQRAGVNIDCVIDINPAKQGKFLAATGIQVQSPEQALANTKSGTDIYVMNSNYLEEIKQLTFNQFNYIAVDHDYI